MFIQGKARRVGDNVNTDQMYPTRYTSIVEDSEMAKHCMEDYDPDLIKRMDPGDVLVAGVGFGCGSSREHAPKSVKAAGFSCVVAKGFSRIFYRNAINIGLPVLEIGADVEKIEPGDEIDVDVNKGEIKILNKNIPIKTPPLPEFIQHIADCGGLINYIKGENK